MDIRGFGLDDDDLAALGYKVARKTPGAPGPERARVASGPIDPSWRMWAATLVVLTVAAWGASAERWLPRAVPGNHPDTAFSSARAMSQLSEIARAPRPMGSPEHARVREHLLGRLRALGLDPEVQTVTVAERDGALARAATVRNVVARVRGTASTGAVALTAHYDGAALTPAAGDGGVGLAAVLETLRAVLAGPPLRNDLVVLLADGREAGLLGARAFVEHHPWMSSVALVMSVDTWGVSGPSLVLETGPRNGRMVQAIVQADPRPAAVPFPGALVGWKTHASDVAPFRNEAVRTLSFTAMGGRALHAQPGEGPASVREETLQHHGLQLLAMTRAFGQLDLTDRARLAGPDRAYFTLPLLGLVSYPASRTLLMSLALLAGWGVVALALRHRGGTMRGVLAGVLMASAVVGTTAAAARSVFGFVRDLHPEYGSLDSAFYREGLHLFALAAMAVATVTAGYALARRRFGAGELVLGALAAPLIAVVWLGSRAPSTAAVAQWAMALALLSAVLVAASGRGRRPGLWEWVVYVLFTMGIFTLLVPSLEVLAGALTLRAAPLLGAAVAAGLLLVLPVMEWLQTPRGWWAPALASVVAVSLIALGTPAVQGGSDHPLPTSLVYLVDHPVPAGDALRMAYFGASGAPAVRRVLGHWLTVPGPGEEWARSWVADPPAGSAAAGPLLLAGGERYELAGTGPASDVTLPRVRVLEDVVEGATRTLEIAVEPGLRGEMLGVLLGDDAGARITSVGGVRWEDAESAPPVLGLTHWGVPEGGAVSVGLRLDAGRPEVSLVVLEHHLRPVEVLGPLFFQRADSVVPNASTGSDRVIQRTSVTLSLGRAVAAAPGS